MTGEFVSVTVNVLLDKLNSILWMYFCRIAPVQAVNVTLERKSAIMVHWVPFDRQTLQLPYIYHNSGMKRGPHSSCPPLCLNGMMKMSEQKNNDEASGLEPLCLNFS